MIIKSIIAREIFDSRGNPTVEAEILTIDGKNGIASVPSGASTGSKEAFELRDGDKKYCHGKCVHKAVDNVLNLISKEVVNNEFNTQKEFDDLIIKLDGTENKSNLGANAILACSLAFSDVFAKSKNLNLFESFGNKNANTLPCPMMNIINGGKHADNALDIQEFMIMPVRADSFKEALIKGVTVFHSLKKLLSDKGLSTNVGDEGGFAPEIGSTDQAMELLIKAIENSGFKLGEDFLLALDCAASEFYDLKNKKYNLKGENCSVNSDELIRKYENLINKYPVFSIEDPFSENDEYGFIEITKLLGNKLQIVGDDLFVTNPDILSIGIKNKMANALLVKPNQIGTVTETIEAINIAKNANYSTIMSHRSGETEDVKISHLAVGLNTGQIKTGSLCRSDRMAKYNELIRIEEKIENPIYFGDEIIKRFNDFVR